MQREYFVLQTIHVHSQVVDVGFETSDGFIAVSEERGDVIEMCCLMAELLLQDCCLLVLSIGLSLGGTTGYAINPARDLGPRIAHAILPVPGKRDSDWGYAWIPVVGPLVGAVLAVLVWNAFAAAPPV